MKSPSPSKHVLLAGGGTGGHLFPAYAVGNELERRGWRVSFTGRAEGLEADWAKKRSKAYYPLASKAVVGRGLTAKAVAAATILRSSLGARKLVKSQSIGVVVGTGGFVSAPAVVGAWLSGCPALLFEPNAQPGKANQWLSRWATEAAVAFDRAADALHCPAQTTGTPVRREFFELPGLASMSDGARLLVLGGSQGARQINEALPKAVARLAANLPGLRVVHQTGTSDLRATEASYQDEGVLDAVEVVPFLDDMPGAMARCHLIVSRAGAITLAEIAAVGRPAVLVPLTIADGHQVENAKSAVATGGAESLVGSEVTSERLAEVLMSLLSDPQGLATRGRKIQSLSHPLATAALADRVEALQEAA